MQWLLLVWWQALYWTFSSAWPRPFDDWKELVFYSGSGLFFLFFIFRNWKSRDLKISAPLIFFLLYLAVGFLAIQTPSYEGWLALSRLLLCGALAYVLWEIGTEKLLGLGRWSVAAAALIVCYSFFEMREIRFWKLPPYFLYPAGYVAYYGDFMALHLPLGFYFLWQEKREAGKFFWGLCSALILAGLWLSGSRAGIFGFIGAACLGIFFFARRQRLQKKALLSLAAAGVLIFLIFGLMQFFYPRNLQYTSTWQRLSQPFHLFSNQPLDNRTNGRWTPLLATADMIREKPFFGWGLGSFRYIFPEYAHRHPNQWVQTENHWYIHPHNEIFHQWVETGAVGILLFLIFWSLIFIGSLWVKKESEKTGLGLMGVTVALISWQMNANFLHPLSRLLAIFYLALLLRQGEFFSFRIPFWGARIFRGMALSLALGAAFLLTAYGYSLYAVEKSMKVETKEEQIFWVETAHRWAPQSFRPLLYYASRYINTEDVQKAQPAIDILHRQFPYVPLVLFQTGLYQMQTGDMPAGLEMLRHALRNAPHFQVAGQVLEEWGKENRPAPE